MESEQRIKLFVRRVEELRNRRMVQEAEGMGFSLKADRVTGVSASLNFPDEENLRSFLLIFRQFIAPKEPIHINKICNLLFQGLRTNNDLRNYLVQAREQWQQTLGKNGAGIKFEEQTLSTKDVANLWINGYYFHNDLEKYDQLEKMFGFGLPFVKAHFVNFVVDATRVIIYLGHLAAYAMRKGLLKFQ